MSLAVGAVLQVVQDALARGLPAVELGGPRGHHPEIAGELPAGGPNAPVACSRVIAAAGTRTVIDRAELAGETIATWPETTETETAHWTGAGLALHDWRPGPALQEAVSHGSSRV